MISSRSEQKEGYCVNNKRVLLVLVGVFLIMELLVFPSYSNNLLRPGACQTQASRKSWDVSVTFSPSEAPTTLFREDLFSDGYVPKGILSTKPKSFFKAFQDEIDNYNLTERCRRYGFGMQSKPGEAKNPNRRIFYGSQLTDEPWEVMDIVATESYGLFTGMVFVEANRTQMFYPRKLRWANDQNRVKQLKEIFGVEHIQIREYVDEDKTKVGLDREYSQRQEILKGWKELGMTKDDLGYMADVDESFTRDMLRAMQWCPYVKYFDYDKHKCSIKDGLMKIIGATRIFESSPECITKDRLWFHPDVVMGACLEEIGDENLHPRASREDGLYRDDPPSTAQNLLKNSLDPLYSAEDFRLTEGGSFVFMDDPKSSGHSAFHLHNFFSNFNTTRNKYLTYMHYNDEAMTMPLENLSMDIRLAVRCAYNYTDGPPHKDVDESERQDYPRVVGGLGDGLPGVMPIYFHDKEYRRRKHEELVRLVKEDDYMRKQRLNWTDEELEIDTLVQQVREAKRFMWAKEAEIKRLEMKIQQSKA